MKPWKYLEHPSFFARQATAAWFLREPLQIIELGSYKTPLLWFLTDEDQINRYIGIDPLAEEENQNFIRSKFPSPEIRTNEAIPYGVALLGMDLDLDSSGREELYRLIDGSRVTVIEFPPAHRPSLSQFEDILAKTNKEVTYQVKFDFSGNKFELEGSAPLMPVRHLYVLKNKGEK